MYLQFHIQPRDDDHLVFSKVTAGISFSRIPGLVIQLDAYTKNLCYVFIYTDGALLRVWWTLDGQFAEPAHGKAKSAARSLVFAIPGPNVCTHNPNGVRSLPKCWINLTCPSIQTPVHEKCRSALVLTPFWAAGHVATDTALQINSLWSSKDAEFHKLTGDINNMPVCHFVKRLFAVDVYVSSRVLCKKRWFSELMEFHGNRIGNWNTWNPIAVGMWNVHLQNAVI